MSDRICSVCSLTPLWSLSLRRHVMLAPTRMLIIALKVCATETLMHERAPRRVLFSEHVPRMYVLGDNAKTVLLSFFLRNTQNCQEII